MCIQVIWSSYKIRFFYVVIITYTHKYAKTFMYCIKCWGCMLQCTLEKKISSGWLKLVPAVCYRHRFVFFLSRTDNIFIYIYILFKVRATPICPERTHKMGFYITWFHYISEIERCGKVRMLIVLRWAVLSCIIRHQRPTT